MKFTQIKIGAILIAVLLGIQSCDVAEETLANLAATQTTIAINSNRYVARYGDNSNDCLSPENPCLTIQGALDKTVSYEHPIIHLVDAGTFDLPADPIDIRLREITRDVTIIGTGDQYFPSSHRILIKNNAHVVLENVNSFSTIFAYSGSLILRNVQINGGLGAGIHTVGHELIIENSSITFNRGPGVVTGDTIATITGSYIGENDGMGIENRGRMTVTETRITNNHNTNEEGEIITATAGVENRGDLDIVRSLIDNNDGIYAIYNSMQTYDSPTPTLNLINSTVSGNRATGSGSATIYNQGKMDIIYSTIAENTGLGILVSSNTEETRIENSLVVSNDGGNCDFSAQLPILEGNNLDTDHSCFPDFTADPNEVASHLGSLRDNGGPTMTHALNLGSPAIDTAEGSCLATDQRKVNRPIGYGCDVGAYENTVQHVSFPLSCVGIQGISIRDNGVMRTNVKVPDASGEYDATLNDIPITCLFYSDYPDTLLCDSPKLPGNTLANLIIFDDQGEEFCNQTFTVPGPSGGQPDKDKDEGCNLSVDICSAQGLSFDVNNCQCVEIQ